MRAALESFDVVPGFGRGAQPAPAQDAPRPAAEPARDASGAGGQEFLGIVDLADALGVTPRTLRFYESRGLLSPRRNRAVRMYGAADRARLTTILKFKSLGFTLSEIRALIDSQHETGEEVPALSRVQCVEQIRMLEQRKRDIDNALSELRRAYSDRYLRDLQAAR